MSNSEPDKRAELTAECDRLYENCLYTSTAFYSQLHDRRKLRTWFAIVPIVLGGIGAWSILQGLDAEWARWLTSGLTLIAGLLPAIYLAAKWDDKIAEEEEAATEFKRLEEPFKQTPLLNRDKPIEEFEQEFRVLMERLNEARSLAATVDPKYFKKAQDKIKAGHYEPD